MEYYKGHQSTNTTQNTATETPMMRMHKKPTNADQIYKGKITVNKGGTQYDLYMKCKKIIEIRPMYTAQNGQTANKPT